MAYQRSFVILLITTVFLYCFLQMQVNNLHSSLQQARSRSKIGAGIGGKVQEGEREETETAEPESNAIGESPKATLTTTTYADSKDNLAEVEPSRMLKNKVLFYVSNKH